MGHESDVIEIPPISRAGYWLGLLTIALTAGYIAAHWSEIPDTFATHYSGSLEPDAWSDKSVLSVFFLTFLGLWLLAVLVACTFPFAHFPIHARHDRSEAGKKATGAAISALLSAMGWFIFALMLCLNMVQLAIVLPAWKSLLNVAFLATLFVALGGSIAMIAYAMSKANKARGGQKRDWRHSSNYQGGMFYNNPDDPAVLVDKRDGIGADFNYAHAPGKIYIAALLLLSFAPLLLVFL
ncbi:DUF1648 domain-containing protein [Corynebacterium sp. H130]|uniref:DUF1648 domain-containing protein n=1 Tax=Corynebacterium sp. H130 TaxID=3133444 RepID=UPI0030AAD67C